MNCLIACHHSTYTCITVDYDSKAHVSCDEKKSLPKWIDDKARQEENDCEYNKQEIT